MATSEFRDELRATVKKIMTPGKGILAADESTGTIGKKFAGVGVENTEANRQAYRELLFSTEGLNNHISGVILYDETARQSNSDGKKFCDMLNEKGIIPGIKLDKGAVPIMGGLNDETATQGLDGLGERCKEYYAMGIRFAKWRAILKIGNGSPSDVSILENCHNLARYGSICQQNGLVPIIEPEVLADGPHDIDACDVATRKVWAAQVTALFNHHIMLDGCMFKPNMITHGFGNPKNETEDPKVTARYTVNALRATMPPAMGGVCFLSGGQSELQATNHLNEMNALKMNPWPLTFSYGRALQNSCIKAWSGKPENKLTAQKALMVRASENSQATLGKYVASKNSGEGGNDDLKEKNYVY